MWLGAESGGDRTFAPEVGFAQCVASRSITELVLAVDACERDAGGDELCLDGGLLFDERIDSLVGRGHIGLRCAERATGRSPFLRKCKSANVGI